MANKIYANKVIANKAEELLTSKVNSRSMMNVDTSMQESAGMEKMVNVYTYNGTAEVVTAGTGNTNRGQISYSTISYPVKMIQQAFDYTDEDIMQDEGILDMMLKGASEVMVNKMNADFFTALTRAGIAKTVWAKTEPLSYDLIVDTLAEMKYEDESKLFILINPTQKAEIRKDADYKAAQMGEVVYNGQVGTIAGLPVVASNDCPEGTVYVLSNDAVTLFLKKDVEIEQTRDADTRTNSVYERACYVVAVTNKSYVKKLVRATA